MYALNAGAVSVLIVAKCIVNGLAKILPVSSSIVLIVAKCIVNLILPNFSHFPNLY